MMRLMSKQSLCCTRKTYAWGSSKEKDYNIIFCSATLPKCFQNVNFRCSTKREKSAEGCKELLNLIIYKSYMSLKPLIY